MATWSSLLIVHVAEKELRWKTNALSFLENVANVLCPRNLRWYGRYIMVGVEWLEILEC